MNAATIVNGPKFIAELTASQGQLRDENLTVNGDAIIVGKEHSLASLCLEGITFTGMVLIKKFEKSSPPFQIRSCNFLGGLGLEHCEGGHLSIMGVAAKWAHFWHCKFEVASFREFGVDGSLDISGFQLTEGFSAHGVTFTELELIHSHTSKWIHTPFVKTDDPIVACQFRLIGVPVFMSTEAVRAGVSTAEGVRSALLTA